MMPAQRTKTYAAAQVADADGILESVSTQTDAAEYEPGDLDGVAITGGVLDLPRTVTITLSDTTGAFATDPIVITGTRGGSVVTESLTPTTADGDETLRGTQVFDTISLVEVPAQADTDGTFTIGVQDICAPYNSEFIGVELAATGTLNVLYGKVSPDAIPVGAAQVGFVKPIRCQRVLTSTALATPTTVGLTVYLP